MKESCDGKVEYLDCSGSNVTATRAIKLYTPVHTHTCTHTVHGQLVKMNKLYELHQC